MFILIHILLVIFGTYFTVTNFNIWSFYNESMGEVLSIITSVALTAGVIVVMHLLAFLVCVILFAIIATISKAEPNPKSKYNHFMTYWLVSYFAFFFRIKVRVYNRTLIPKDETFVLYANHQAQVDIICVIKGLKIRSYAFLSKPGVFKWPFVSTLMIRMGCIPLNNQSDREAAVAIIKGIEQVKNDVSMVIFPSGRRSHSHDVDEFKAGAFKLAMKPEATILPATVNDAYKAERTLWNVFRNSRCSITFHKPIRYEEYKHLNSQELSDMVRSIIESGIRK